MKKSILIVAVIVVTVAAVWHFGMEGFAALLGLLIPTGEDNRKKADSQLGEALVHEELAKHEANQANTHKENAEKIRDDITQVINTPIDKNKPIDEVVKNVRKDLD